MLCLRITPDNDKVKSPMELLMGRKAKSNLPIVLRNEHDDRDRVNDSLKEQQDRQKFYYNNRSVKELPTLCSSQRVRIQDHVSGQWMPVKLVEKCSDRSYLVEFAEIENTSECPSDSVKSSSDRKSDTSVCVDQKPIVRHVAFNLPACESVQPVDCEKTKSIQRPDSPSESPGCSRYGRIFHLPKRFLDETKLLLHILHVHHCLPVYVEDLPEPTPGHQCTRPQLLPVDGLRHIYSRHRCGVQVEFVLDCVRVSRHAVYRAAQYPDLLQWSLETRAIFGAVKQPADFASFLLTIFISNLLLYSFFYIVMKIRSKEKIPHLTKMCIVFSMVTWGSALFFFFSYLTSWQLSAAQSRVGNKNCLMLDFFDAHDIWHFLSAISLFFSFLILLTLDDDLYYTRRDKIPVF
ncbi:hypothetical protein ScPMuIL_003046 [Solemya velum]